MTSLPFDFSETLEAFECPETITVYEKTGEYVDGYWVETKDNERELSCILLNMDEKKLEIIFEVVYQCVCLLGLDRVILLVVYV